MSVLKILTRDAHSGAEENWNVSDLEHLCAEAKGLLGYELSPEATQALEVKKRSREIRSALAKLAYPPFNAASVEKYKKKAARVVIPMAQRIDDLSAACVLSGLAISCFCWFVWVCMLARFEVICWLFGWLSVVSVFSGLISFACLLATTVKRNNLGIADVQAHWVVIPLSLYKSPVPAFALQTAIDLKKAFPEVECMIEELQVEKMPRDPFLRIDLPDGSSAYMEVWSEPAFHGQRMA